MEIDKFDRAVIELLTQRDPLVGRITRWIAQNLPDNVINWVWEAQGLSDHYPMHRRRKYLASTTIAPKLGSMVRRGILVKVQTYEGVRWKLGPVSDMLKEQGLID